MTAIDRTTTYNMQRVGDVDMFYRAAGPADAPTVLLLHGFPSSSHMYRDLIPELAGSHRVIAPDLPGFGQTRAPGRDRFAYTFDRLSEVMEDFMEALGLRSYALYIFDYGAPVGLRLAMAHPERVTAIVSQNGNAYEEGLSGNWGPWRAYWVDPAEDKRDACRASLDPDGIRDSQYLHGADAPRVSPDGYTLDAAYMARAGAAEIQLDLIRDYRTNVALYPAFQAYFRKHRPPLLAIWGRNDLFFLPEGAEAYRRDLPEAEVVLLDAGHFALETHAAEIGKRMRGFLAKVADERGGGPV